MGLPALICLVSITPLIWQWEHFRDLYWFHDDWELISQWNQSGLGKWLWQPMAESYAPLFKIFWAAAIRLFRGSYAAMIVLLWVTHLGIVFVAGRIFLRCGFSKSAMALSALTIGLPWSNIETLGWAPQWSQLLSTLFLLLSWDQLMSAMEEEHAQVWRWAAVFATALASAACFVRGVLTGAVLATFFMLVSSEQPGRRRFKVAALLLLATMLGMSTYWTFAINHGMFQDDGGEKIAGVIRYALGYELINPLFHLLPIPRKSPDLRAVMICGAFKLFVVVTALSITRLRKRAVLLTLLMFDLITALLLGVGRSELGLNGATSYRYQYVSLLCFAPFFGRTAARAVELLWFRRFLSNAVFALFFTGWTLLLGYPWARHSERWARWRGLEPREALAIAQDNERFGLASLTARRARELIRIYHLH
jgi:hypothetical protein